MIVFEDWSDTKVYAEYSSFRLEPESEFYRLRLGTYQGNAGDSMMWHNGKQFTTLDRDKDMYSHGSWDSCDFQGFSDEGRMPVRCMKEQNIESGDNEGYTGSDYDWE